MERIHEVTRSSALVAEGRSYPSLRQAVGLCLLFCALQVSVAILCSVIDGVFKTECWRHPAFVVVSQLVAGALTLAAALRRGRLLARQVFAWRPIGAAAMAAATLATLGASILLSEADNLLNLVLPQPKELTDFVGQLFGSQHPVWALVALVVAAPVVEETLFRGLVLRGLLGRYPAGRAILTTALLFAAIHLNPWQALGAVFMGILLGWFSVRTRSLLPAVLGHAVANATAYVIAFLPFQIQGLTPVDVVTPGVFQPWWLDALGLSMLAFGIWAFAVATGSRPVPGETPATACAADAERAVRKEPAAAGLAESVGTCD
jgi:membrane protease YdiL (CAAX protease family)